MEFSFSFFLGEWILIELFISSEESKFINDLDVCVHSAFVFVLPVL